ncbi:MAG: GH25 family lysozyme [Liquorilactobacillus sp.]|uniref:GH25 family lysozyme n=1 Tax=Liquorilactobacillus nagelii TaxID=82688 RepID=UPI0039EAC8CF
MKKKVLLGALAFASAFLFAVAASADRDQGVDLSRYQGSTAVFGQASDKFAISQIGGYYDGTFYPQSTYQSQVASTIAQGKRAHTYIYAQFSTRQQADEMLNYYLSRIQTPKNSIIALDVESGSPNTDAVMYALNKVKQAGYTPVLYGYLNFLKAHLNLSTIADSYPLWLAEYPDYQVRTSPDYNYFPSYKNIHLFQFTSTYKAGGLDGNVDLLGITKNGYDGTTTSTQGGTAVKATTTTTAIKQGQEANNTPKSNIVVGYTVKVNFSASKWSNGYAIPSWAKGKSYKVQQVSGSKVLLTGILSWIDKSNVEILQTAKQVTSTSTSSSTLPAGVHAQSGYFTPNQRLMVWHGAGVSPTYQYYYAGESIKYVGYIDNYAAGYRYVVYKGASGNWCYVADRHLSPNYMLGYAR